MRRGLLSTHSNNRASALIAAGVVLFSTPICVHAQVQSATGAASAPASAGDIVSQEKRISNAFQDTDLKQALSDLGLSAGVSIVPDETVQGNVSATIKNRTIEEALDILLLPGGYCWIKIGDAILVGKGEPTSPNFLRFASSRVYKPNYATAEKLATLLPTSMSGYVRSAPGELTLTVTAPPMMMARIMQDIKMLDSPLPRIVLEAMVIEADASTLNNYDLSFTWKNFGFTDSAATPSSSFQYSQISQNDAATLTALINKGKAQIKASPRIMTLEGKEASVEVGQENYFEVISGPVSYPVATIQLIKTGITLKMTPFLSDDGQVTVTLNPEVSDATGAGANGLPINTVRKASTTVRVKDGETIVIGGMTFETKRKSENKVPILGDLPLLGSLFRFHNDSYTKQDVIILVTPRVVRDGLDTEDLGKPISKVPAAIDKPIVKVRNGKEKPVAGTGDAPLAPVNSGGGTTQISPIEEVKANNVAQTVLVSSLDSNFNPERVGQDDLKVDAPISCLSGAVRQPTPQRPLAVKKAVQLTKTIQIKKGASAAAGNATFVPWEWTL